MKFRLSEGGGEALYELGVEDNGHPHGISNAELAESIRTVASMAKSLHFDYSVVRIRSGEFGKVAEVLVRQCSEEKVLDIRVCLVGDGDAGEVSFHSWMARLFIIPIPLSVVDLSSYINPLFDCALHMFVVWMLARFVFLLHLVVILLCCPFWRRFWFFLFLCCFFCNLPLSFTLVLQS